MPGSRQRGVAVGGGERERGHSSPGQGMPGVWHSEPLRTSGRACEVCFGLPLEGWLQHRLLLLGAGLVAEASP